ncbi:MAG: AbrB/MazE/SpoVT family DNA-binding domain-containing protein [Nanoarchaeota archaeon]|nr:AbrB/MazE/SpoVT family DNA-binding domain-containing protein [Nanoarchaeota archaeon]
MEHVKALDFNGYRIAGWKCACGEKYYEPEGAQKVLLLNKLKKQSLKAKLGRIKSNLILRLPTDIEHALNLKQGEDVFISIENDAIKVVPA